MSAPAILSYLIGLAGQPRNINDYSKSRIVVRYLISPYNWGRFPFNLTDFRCLDSEIFADGLSVLKLDNGWLRKVNLYIEDGKYLWEHLAQQSEFNDYQNGSWK